MTAAAISGSFADYRLVKSRSVLQLVIEIPVEGQAAAFDALGYPMPGVEIPVAIARLKSVTTDDMLVTKQPACAPLRERPAAVHSSPRAGGGAISPKERYASLPVNEQAKQRAGMLPDDPRFLAWVQERLISSGGSAPDIVTEIDAVDFIRNACCFGQSRKRIAEDPEAYDRFIAMETAFRIDIGELPEPRG